MTKEIEFLLGKAIFNEEFRKQILPYLDQVKVESEEQQKILECLMQENFSAEDIIKKHGQKTCAYAFDLVEFHDKKVYGNPLRRY